MISTRSFAYKFAKTAAAISVVLAVAFSGLGPAVAHAPGETVAGAEASTDQVRSITFPVVGSVTYSDTWGACRGSGCSRSHKGVDIFGPKLAPLVAAADGTIVSDRRSGLTNAGNKVTIQDDEGWIYLYLHLNNDSPGTDDGANPQAWILPSGLSVGDRVTAGQVVGYLGDSGNAETTPPHLHFEIHPPGQAAINPTASVNDARDQGRVVTAASLASTVEGRAQHSDLVTAWYRALLKREPTDAEMMAWTDRFAIGAATRADLIADLTMARPRRDQAGVIVRAYEVVLQRRPNLQEIRSWLASDGLSATAVASSLLASEEFSQRHGPLSDEQFISVIYNQALGRDATSERLADWLAAFADGESRPVLAAYLAETYQVKDRTWHSLEIVQGYRAGLDRMPTDAEHAQWVAYLDGGGHLAAVVAEIRATG